MSQKEYPREYFVPLTGHEFLLGRITLAPILKEGRRFFHGDLDIVQKESKKIFSHIGVYTLSENEDEAIDLAMQKLSDFLRKKRVKNLTL